MMTIDLYNISMVGITYIDKTVKVDVTLPSSLIKQNAPVKPKMVTVLNFRNGI